MKLTPKQQRFADEYIKTGNATQSAIEAGYIKKTAQQIGAEKLLKHVIKLCITERMEQIASNRVMGYTEAVELLISIARGELMEEATEYLRLKTSHSLTCDCVRKSMTRNRY